MDDVRVVRVEYDNEASPADEWIKRLIEHLLIVKLELLPKDVAHFLMSTMIQPDDSNASEEV